MVIARRSMFSLLTLAAASLACAAPSAAQAPSWPQRAVKFVIPLGPGSGVDITARVFADKLSAKWGQPVVVENRPGGDAFVAITSVTSAHDDHVLLFAPASTFTAHPLLHAKLPYDINDLVPIARVTNTLIAIGVPASLGVNTLAELPPRLRQTVLLISDKVPSGATAEDADTLARYEGLQKGVNNYNWFMEDATA